MKSPRQHVHRGVVEAAAILIDEALVGAREARLRAVRAWSPGASVFRVRGALLVRFPAPRPVDCARAAGAPLVRIAPGTASALASAPLAPDEIAAAAPPPGSIAIVREDAIAVVIPAEADREDPAAYLDLDAFRVIRVEPLGAPPAPAQIVGAQTIAPRELLGIGRAPAEQAQIIAAIAALRASPGARARPRAADEDDARRAQVLSIFATILAAAAGLFARLFPSSTARSTSRALPEKSGSDRALAAAPAEPAGPSLADRIAARMRSLVAELLVRARLAHLIGRRQAEYLGKLLDMLDGGDLMEALRHAIPLGGKAEGTGGGSPMLGVPEPRRDLAISLAEVRSGGSSMFATEDLYAHLRAKYRAAFERLEREGRIEEAAFVLAELLHEEAEAVSFLERHGKLRLAAELAEARKLTPGLVVRQWFLAGDAARAVRIARRHRAFADAVARLEKSHDATELRLLWADSLAEAGDFAAAIDVVWPIAEARRIVEAWIDHAIAQGGALAARMLMKKLAAWPDTFADVLPIALAILSDDGPRATYDRRALAEALPTAPNAPGARTIARAAARALIKDSALLGDPAARQLVAKLVTFADDGPIRFDLPSWPTVERAHLSLITSPRTIEIGAADTGTMEIHDAAHLPNGNTAIALGEAGVRVIARSGRTLFHLDQPAHRLVVSDHGDRAIAIAPRGKATRLARLDLVGRRSEPWCEAPPLAGAEGFDGSQWAVLTAGELVVVDALETRFSALERLDLDLARSTGVIARGFISCSLASVAPNGKLVRARCDLPGWTLRLRAPVDVAIDPENDVIGIHEDGAAGILTSSKHQGVGLVQVGKAGTIRELWLPGTLGARPHRVVMRNAWIACAAVFPDRIEAHFVDERALQPRARVVLHGAKRASLRICDDTFVIADHRGRLLVIEHAHGSVVHDLRV